MIKKKKNLNCCCLTQWTWKKGKLKFDRVRNLEEFHHVIAEERWLRRANGKVGLVPREIALCNITLVDCVLVPLEASSLHLLLLILQIQDVLDDWDSGRERRIIHSDANQKI